MRQHSIPRKAGLAYNPVIDASPMVILHLLAAVQYTRKTA
jgi:hypothetical protein